MAADLHCHTTMSDGSDTPEFVVRLAKNIGLSALAITDHDCYGGSFGAARLGEKIGIRVIEGVECSCRDVGRGHKVHILCYNCRYPEAIEAVLQKANQARAKAAAEMIHKVSKLYPITEEMVMDGAGQGGFIGKQHIMLALMKAGCADEMFGDLFKALFSAKHGSCFVPIQHNDMLETVDVLHQSGGVIVLAHPSVYGSIASLEDLIKVGIHGVEINHPRNKPQDIAVLQEAVNRHGLLVTGGTDFHGYFAERNRFSPLGQYTASDEQLERLLEKSAALWQR